MNIGVVVRFESGGPVSPLIHDVSGNGNFRNRQDTPITGPSIAASRTNKTTSMRNNIIREEDGM